MPKIDGQAGNARLVVFLAKDRATRVMLDVVDGSLRRARELREQREREEAERRAREAAAERSAQAERVEEQSAEALRERIERVARDIAERQARREAEAAADAARAPLTRATLDRSA